MKQKKEYNLSSLKDSGVFFGGFCQDEKRLYVFPCVCGDNDHPLSVLYWHSNYETDLNWSYLQISRNLRTTSRKRRWEKSFEYLLRNRVDIGMGDGTAFSMLSIQEWIEVMEGYVQFMKDNFSERELAGIEHRPIKIREFVGKKSIKVRQFNKIIREDPCTDITLVIESDDDSAQLSPREKQYLFCVGLTITDGFRSIPFEISWTLPFNVGFLRRVWYVIQYLFGKRSSYETADLYLRYPEVIMLIDHLKNLLARANEGYAEIDGRKQDT